MEAKRLMKVTYQDLKKGIRLRSGRISFAKRQRDMVCRCLVE